MLEYLHVKNLALIEEAELDFTKGLNILTGETGAGKSLLIGSVTLALGGKVSREMIREGADAALVELVFSLDTKQQKEHMEALGFDVSDGELILSRKITDTRSVNRINGETVTAAMLKEAAMGLLDLHGQHEYQTLLNKKKHLEIVDRFAGDALKGDAEKLKVLYSEYRQVLAELSETGLDEAARKKETDYLQYQIREIEEANLLSGEDEDLESRFNLMSNGKRIAEVLGEIHEKTAYDSYQAAGEAIGDALMKLSNISQLDPRLANLEEQLVSIDGLLNDFNRELSGLSEELEFSPEEFRQTEKRLNTINELKAKYGRTIEAVLDTKAEAEERLSELEHYEERREELAAREAGLKKELEKLCTEVSKIRQKAALALSEQIRTHLLDLNFLDVRFEIAFTRTNGFTANGFDEAEFLISVNPGEPLRPLAKVASGGELSRIMLAIKTVLADKDEVSCVIFDEIDTGISGRTAQKVSEKLSLIGKSRQVICITHLAQIAAMADTHFLIEKSAEDDTVRTSIRTLSEQESIEELARILGGTRITNTVLKSAEEMRRMAHSGV